MTLNHKLTIGFGAALCVLATIGFLSYQDFSRENVDQQWVAHTHQVLGKLDATLAALLELNADERGYTLTHQDAYLQSCQRLKTELDSKVAELKTLPADNPIQQSALARLTELVSSRLALTRQLERYAVADLTGRHPRLALDHGLAVHRASLRWAKHAIATLSAAPTP